MAFDVTPRPVRAGWTRPRRRRALEVAIGEVTIGGAHPIAVQSMTTTPTADAVATAGQIAVLARSGCAFARVTVPSGPDADALPEIRKILAAEGVSIPLVADIHFTPRLAMRVVEHVDKVRVNPGNFTDRKSVAGKDYDDARWDEDVARLAEQFGPLADRARELGVALRIGVNHGSLSDRILQRHGDTPEGMVASALEFIEIAEDRGHRGLVVSMKASVPSVMVRAYRHLVAALDARETPYPIHLGVTEAGGGDEGRIKSSVGMGVLLADGIGDTIRVSLTEAPENEVPVARELVERFERSLEDEPAAEGDAEGETVELREVRTPLDPVRRPAAKITVAGHEMGGDAVPAVELTLPLDGTGSETGSVSGRGFPLEVVDLDASDAGSLEEMPARLATLRSRYESVGLSDRGLPPAIGLTVALAAWSEIVPDLRHEIAGAADRIALVVDGEDSEKGAALAAELAEKLPVLVLLRVASDMPAAVEPIVRFASSLAGAAPQIACGLIVAREGDYVAAYRALAAALDRSGARMPIVLTMPDLTGEDPRVGAGGRLGALLVDGIGDAVRGPDPRDAPEGRGALHHMVVQAAGRRQERAEFIACPSCGRTLFDLEATTAKIRELTGHLKLKIAVMGCIVNGPGEMADADFGFVGWGPEKVALFVGRQMVEKDVPYAEAPGRLVELIQEHGRWAEPAEESA